ncbi:MAG: DUF1684 domain-containing protein [Proteobacteria bacterium]|nr:DUF1684 domain-containing protein [Pseudomonadota bacterium]
MTRALVAILLMTPSFGAAEPAQPQVLSDGDAAKARKEIGYYREETKAHLKSGVTSFLAAVARKDFGKKSALTVGSAADNDVVLADPGVKPHHVRITAEADRFQVEAVDPGGEFVVGRPGTVPPVRQATVLGTPIRLGRFTLRLSHQGYPAVIVFDPRSPRLKEYHGIEYFPIDLSYRFNVKLVPDPAAQTLAIKSTRSADRKAERAGWFEFTVGGKPQRLAATRLIEPGFPKDALLVLFHDLTSGKETYGAGRYVEPERLATGEYILDFNRAYSPYCAFSEHYNCPLPPQENYLKAAIRAGERDSKYH